MICKIIFCQKVSPSFFFLNIFKKSSRKPIAPKPKKRRSSGWNWSGRKRNPRNAITATKLALKSSDYVVTEAGFGSDLGAEKFFDIKCRQGKLNPSAVVLVITHQAYIIHGIENIEKHVETLKMFGVLFVIAINKKKNDADDGAKRNLVWWGNIWEEPSRNGHEKNQRSIKGCCLFWSNLNSFLIIQLINRFKFFSRAICGIIVGFLVEKLNHSY